MAQIKTVLREHDIAGIVLLQSETHGEWCYRINPSWSAARVLKDVQGHERIHFDATTKQKRLLDLTTGMVITFRDSADRISAHMELMLVELAKHLEIQHVSRDTCGMPAPSPSPSAAAT